jgi:hypothetical protein
MKYETVIGLPVPVERIAEDLCDLSILWEPIPEPPNKTILAGLKPAERLIRFNEDRRALFEDTLFLYNTVLAHEIGHWDLHVDHAILDHPMLPGFDRPQQFVCEVGGDSWAERQAKWFASFLLLPRDLLTAEIIGREIRTLSDMYRLHDRCEVTITVMRIALERMGRGYVGAEGRVYPSRAEYEGQGRLR